MSESIKKLFSELKAQFQDSPTTIYAIEVIEPLEHEYEMADWKLQLKGFIQALASIKRLDPRFLTLLDDCSKPTIEFDNEGQRVGRENKFSIDIATKQQVFQFDVPARNPLDSYLQLTKRVSYRAIPGILSAKIFTGSIEERDKQQLPIKEIGKDEHIFVKPLY